MIYFKFPFDEQLYSTDENSNTNSINFHSFNNAERIDIAGKVIEKDLSEFENSAISSQILPEDETQFIAETQEEYLQKLEEVIKIIKENNLPKLVLSRRKIFTDFTEINLKESFNNLCRNYPNAFKYLFFDGETSWMGAFSEVLGKFNKSTHEFETMSIAGTIPVSEEWTEKEIDEQKPVSSYIRNTLTKYAALSEVQESETYDHISGNIKHLKTDFKIKINPEDLDSIIQELHPTPAVCGIPKDFCREIIEKVEKFPRELYAGYIKIETEDYIQYFVNLRCARLYKNSVHLFVGGGITAQSNPEKEWQETELKSEAVLKNLVIS
ncbi:chorismate-binding protein [Chryseobacterium indoltheticum]|uniref:chorismate-binding protein n=1 Tax=Chryseobacterium indoltheticum TaxID=254 RepID=UPI001913CA29|nr:chorismate-binding protein [Chryseobacterium indoltheticum]QQQ30010.1 chorismate-binding protein [Chryseobacterium indoltheticum]